tara:strand:- start:1551 stop:2570 length:1020 start_codon:yes stop_codon:yes gene_type:complete
MDKVACLSPTDRSDLFRAVADQKGVTVQIIEKDFWVCWVLRQLAGLDSLPADIFFKGGTSLSKVFHVIERMSEDIDLVIDRKALGFTGDRDPMQEGISGKQRERLIDALKAEAVSFVDGPLFDYLNKRFTEILGESDEWSIRADVENPDNANIYFSYPTNEEPSEYLRTEVLLELGARGDTWPTVNGTVRPYAAELFPDQFEYPDAPVQAISAQRTFWEKVTLLHSLVHLGEEKMIKAKPARHLYDIYQLGNNELGREAVLDIDLLASVIEHKKVFYKRTASKYELAVPGTLRILPSKELAEVLRPEYEQMTEIMIFGDSPDFDVVVDELLNIEYQINH